MSDTQNPGGWPDAEEERLWALAPAHLRVLVDRRIAAREAAARRKGIEAAAKEVDCGCDIRDAVLARLEAQGQKRASWLCQHGDVCCALQADEIRTLKWESER